MIDKIIIHTDGGARGNPGPSAIGAVLEYNGQTEKLKEYIGEATNNQAEYKAVVMALDRAKALEAQEVDLFLDSELVQRQLTRQYKVKDSDLAQLFVQCWNLSLSFKKIKFIHVPRAENKEADRLVNEALDEQG